LCLTILHIFYILYYILAYIQHNGNVSLENSILTFYTCFNGYIGSK